jgi:hypothetical protein
MPNQPEKVMAWFVSCLVLFLVPSVPAITNIAVSAVCEDLSEDEDIPQESRETCTSAEAILWVGSMLAYAIPFAIGARISKSLGFPAFVGLIATLIVAVVEAFLLSGL